MVYYEEKRPDDGRNENGQPIIAGNGGSQNFRIPCIVTLDDGSIVAAADVRWDTEADGGGMDIIVSRSKNMGETWDYTFPDYLGDNGNVYNEDSSTLMDPAVATDGSKLYLLVDLFAGGCSMFRKTLKDGNGFTKEGYLRVRKKGTEDYDYYVKDNKIYAPDGTVVENYYVDEWFHMTEKGTYKGNLFYKDVPYEIYPTSYLCITTSEDGGKTWSAPSLIQGVKNEEESFYGTGPGRGLVTEDGTLIFCCYNGVYASVIFSKDQGKTWNRFGEIPGTESQPIQLKDGTIRIFFRNLQDAICYADMTAVGDTYEMRSVVNTKIPNCSSCMISALSYSKKIDGKEVVFVCCPSVVGRVDGRFNGKIFVFTLDDQNKMTLHNTYCVNGRKEKEFFAYSCMTELSDGSIGLLYEDSCKKYQGKPQGVGYSRVIYKNIPVEEIVPNAQIDEVHK